MDRQQEVNHTFADHGKYLHRRDETLRKTEKDYTKNK